MRLTTKKGRLFAFKLRAKRNKRTGKKVWYVGITTKEHFWLDLNTTKSSQVRELAVQLMQRLRTAVYIVETNKSYWLVTKQKLEREEWRKEYAFWLNNYDDTVVCHAFCLCCLRYNKATLRVSNKNGKRPKIIGIIGLTRKFFPKNKDLRLENWSNTPIPRQRTLNPAPPRVHIMNCPTET